MLKCLPLLLTDHVQYGGLFDRCSISTCSFPKKQPLRRLTTPGLIPYVFREVREVFSVPRYNVEREDQWINVHVHGRRSERRSPKSSTLDQAGDWTRYFLVGSQRSSIRDLTNSANLTHWAPETKPHWAPKLTAMRAWIWTDQSVRYPDILLYVRMKLMNTLVFLFLVQLMMPYILE